MHIGLIPKFALLTVCEGSHLQWCAENSRRFTAENKDIRRKRQRIGSLSPRSAASRFAVSESCAIKLVRRWKRTGSVEPEAMGGHKPFALARHEKLVRAPVAAQSDLAGRRSIVISGGVGADAQKDAPRRRARSHRTSRPRGRRGARTRHALDRSIASSSSTRPGCRRPTWRGPTPVAPRSASGRSAPYRTAIGRPAPSWPPLRCDRLDAPCVIDGPINGLTLPSLYRAVPRSHPDARRHRHHGQSRHPQGPRRAPRPSERAGAHPALTCRPIVPISIPSSRSSPSSRLPRSLRPLADRRLQPPPS